MKRHVMKIDSLPVIAPFRLFRPLRHVPGRYLGLGALAAVAVSPDLVLLLVVNAAHVMWAVLHAVIGVLELSIEHLVAEVFEVSRHTAQIITAWILLLLFLLLAGWLVRKFLLRPIPVTAEAAADAGDAGTDSRT